MNTFYQRAIAASCCFVLLFSGLGFAATVEPGVGYTNDFSLEPASADWATLSLGTSAQEAYEANGDVNANITTAAVATGLASSPGNPPAAASLATWSSVGQYLQTRPTGNKYTALMGKFANNTGTNATQVTISYQFSIVEGGINEEADHGTRAYYSLTGAAGSWVNIPVLNSTASANSVIQQVADLSVDWTNGASLFVLWIDDNATGQGTDAGNQIDNFSLRVTAGLPLVTSLTATLTSPGNNGVFPSGNVPLASADVVFGVQPITVEFFTNSGVGNTVFTSAGTVSTSPYSMNLGALLPGAYNIYAVATDSASPAASTNTTTNTFFVADPLTVALNSPIHDSTVDNATPVAGSVSVSGGREPYSVQFYVDGSPVGPAITASPYDYNFGTLFVGDRSIHARVTDASGWASNSPIHTVHVTGPLAVSISPTNGASLTFGQNLILTAGAGGGTGPYQVSFFTNGQLAATVSSAPFAVNLGRVAPGSYAVHAEAADSSTPAQAANSGTNIVTVTPNPIVVTLTAPTNAITVASGSTVAMAATASVSSPLNIAQVEFFMDGVSRGVDTSAPYAASVANITTGNHSFYAVATDNLGRAANSGTNQVTASAPSGNNNNFANAIPIFGPIATVTGSNVGAGREQGEPFHANNFGGPTVWWSWTAPASGPTTIDTEGSDFNTVLAVYTGNAVNQLTVVAFNNDYQGNTWSRVDFNAIAGTTYRIVVDGARTGGFQQPPASGNIVLHVKGVGGLNVTPTNGSIFTIGTPITITATTDENFPNPPATRVDFYHRGAMFASDSEAPFTAVGTNWPSGSNSFYVVAVDSLGNPIQSSVINVLVQNVGLTITSPAEDVYYSEGAPVTVNAWAYLPSGTITNVTFLVDGTPFATDDTAPFSGVWTAVGGSRRLTAVGLADDGSSYVSQPVNIGVATTIIPFGSVWKFLDNGTDQGTNWITSTFDDSTWKSGPTEIGYGDGDEATVAEDNATPGYSPQDSDRYITTYFRRTLLITNTASFTNIILGLERDDAGVVYLNGVEILRSPNLPQSPTNITFDTVATGQGLEDTVDFANLAPSLLRTGENILAVEIHQQAPNSSDISFNLLLLGIPEIIHNLSPTVTLNAPTNNSYYLAPASITLEATAADSDGSVTKVEFFTDGVKLGEDTTEPYSLVWNNPPIKAHNLTAVATDDLGATTTSAKVFIVVYDAVGTPVAAITSPADGAVMEGPTNLLVTATANAISGITNVEFLANGTVYATDTTAPYSAIWSTPFGTNVLTLIAYDAGGVPGTSPPVTVVITIPPTNTVPPTITTQFPGGGSTITNLTNIIVRFSEYVQNVDASDLLINGIPATSVDANHSRSNYTFTFPRPAYGQVNISWASGHGITDYGWPTVLPFDGTGPGATWSYDLIDTTPPFVAVRTPASGATVTNATEITVTFSEPVTGVDVADLLLNNVPAYALSSNGNTYVFSVAKQPSGTKTVSWVTNHGIMDVAVTPNAFNRTNAGNTWTFTLDARTTFVQTNASWKLFKGLTEASSPPGAWRFPGFDDSSWSNAPAPFFYGDPYSNGVPAYTHLTDMRSNYSSIFLRQEFVVADKTVVTNLAINAQSDDGYIVWINGVEAARYNMPGGDIPFTGISIGASPEPNNAGAGFIARTLTNSGAAIVNGTNVVAIQAFNESLATSSDFGFNAQIYTYLTDPSTVPPRIFNVQPAPGDLLYLTNITITFTEGVSGVNASDLLINGSPASSVVNPTNGTYTFRFTQPAYGPVFITWDTNHGIADFDVPPRPFNATGAGATFQYGLFNPSNPRIVSQSPASSSTVTGLTSIAVTFTEGVAGVDASDFLINNRPASSVSTVDGITHTFVFAQPAFGPVAISWTNTHAITDLETPSNGFDGTRFGARWNYTLIDPVPSVAITTPTNNSYVLTPATVTVTAAATDNDGTVARVEFFSQGVSVGEDLQAPYSVVVSNLLEGVYVFRATVTDNMGFSRTSAPVTLNVVTNLPTALVRGPYLQLGTTNSAIIRWRTDAPSDAVLYYGKELAAMTNVVTRSSRSNEHIMLVEGLEADTKYYYSIGDSSYRQAGGPIDGANYWFQTSPHVGTRRPFRFWVLGDAGTAGNGAPDRQQSTRDAFYNLAAQQGKPADAWLLLGDNAYNSGTDVEHQRAVFDMYPTMLRNRVVWPTIGNHETAQSTTANDFPYLNIFSLPTAGQAGGVPSGTEKYYSFDHGNVHFVCLDSMTSGLGANTPMMQWLQNDLQSTAQEWIIVFFHHPPLTKGSHDSDRENDLVQIRQNWTPIFETNGVDLVLSGHSHCWERSYLLHGHYGQSTTLTEAMKVDGGDGRENGSGPYRKNSHGHGIVYTVAGNAGQATGGTLNHPAHFMSLNELGTMVIDISSNRLDAISLTASGTTNDYFTLLKPDLTPRTPLDLLALPTAVDQITLAWTPGSTNATTYSIERSVDGVNFSEQLVAPGDSVTAVDSNLLVNTTYYYRMRAVNESGVSDFSQIASATTVLADALPAAPTQLHASAGQGVQFYRSQMVVTWRDNSSNEGAFQIERSLTGSDFTPIATVAAGINHYIDRGLESATPHYYQVRALNSLGASPPSNADSDVTHPQTRVALEGTTAVFHAGVEGVAPVRYQWQFNDQPIVGQTNEALILENVEMADEGDYTVLIVDASQRLVSNPAYLFVVGPPKIVVQPQGRLDVVGTSGSLEVVVTGTAPLRYQWRRNGLAIPGASDPTLVFSSLQTSDQGTYDVVVENDFGQVISQTAFIRVTTPPSVTPQPMFYGEVLKPLAISNSVMDANNPPLQLTWYVLPESVSNVRLDPVSGALMWVPQRVHAAKTNSIFLGISDARHPLLTNTLEILVSVSNYFEVTIGTAVLPAGTNGSVPLLLYSSAGLTNLTWELQWPGTRLTNCTLENGVPGLAAGALHSPGSNSVILSFDAAEGQSLQGTQQLGRLRFDAVPGQVSAFVPLDITSTAARAIAPEISPTALVNDGRVVVIGGSRPLLEQIPGAPNQRLLMLYGSPTGRYDLEYSTNTLNGPWRNRGTLVMTNYFRLQNVTTSPPPPIFYRARQR